jgi:hypothetical protein
VQQLEKLVKQLEVAMKEVTLKVWVVKAIEAKEWKELQEAFLEE